MATTHNIAVKRGDTYDGESFRIKESTIVSILPVTGEAGIVYYLSTTKVYYIWSGTEYTVTTGGAVVDLTGSYLVERTEELSRRESNLAAREARLAERERLIREAEERASTDRTDLTELSSIIAGIIELSTTK